VPQIMLVQAIARKPMVMALDTPGDRPAGIARDRLQNTGNENIAADRDTAEQAPGCDNHPAIVRVGHSGSPMHFSKCKTNGMGRNRQPERAPDHFFSARDPLQNPLIQRVPRRWLWATKVDVQYASRASESE